MKHSFLSYIKTSLQLVALFSALVLPSAVYAAHSGPELPVGALEPQSVYDNSGTLLRSESGITGQYVPDEIIIKFNPQASAAIRERLNSALRVGGSEDIGIPTIQEMNVKHRVKHIEPVHRMLHGRLRSGKTLDDIHKEIGRKYPQRAKRSVHKGGAPDVSGIYRIKMPRNLEHNEIKGIVAEYTSDPNVEYAELNYIVKAAFVPNDPYFSSSGSWGQPYYDMWGLKKIDIERAWDVARGMPSSPIVVAVIDSGVDYTHPDLASNVWPNSDETCTDGIDHDGNGFINDCRGWDFTTCQTYNLSSGACLTTKNRDNNPLDDHGHGTHVSGTIAAAVDNGIGISGIALNTKIMPVKALNYQGMGSIADLAAAITYAADNGADVQNLSWGGSGQSQTIHNAIKYAHSMGCVIVAAAGNDNSDVQFYSPAHLKEVITVSSTDHNDIKSGFSNYGNLLDVAAPGGDSAGTSPLYPDTNILSLRAAGTDMYCSGSNPICNTFIVGNYYYRSRGTSMAAPHVSGLAALILSVHPEFSNEQVRQAIRVGSDDLGTPGFDNTYGFGRINAYRSIQINSPCTSWIQEPAYQSFLSGTVNITGTASCGDLQSYRLEYGSGDSPASYTLLGQSNIPVSNGVIFSWDTQAVPTGNYTLRLTVTDSAGNSYLDKVLVRIDPIMANAWYFDTGNYMAIFTNPSFADIDGDGFKEIIAANIGVREIHVFRHDGAIVPGWPVKINGSGWLNNYLTPPTIGDLDNDGRSEIFINTSSGVYGFDYAGNPLPGWPKETVKRFDAPVVLADINGDGHLEVLAVSLTPYGTQNPAYLYAWDRSGFLLSGFPVNVGKSTSVNNLAVGDLDPANPGLEIVVPTTDGSNGTIAFYNYQGTGILSRFLAGVNTGIYVSLGDVNADGLLEIVYFGRYYTGVYIGVLDRLLNPVSSWNYPAQIDLSTPVLGDLDNNGTIEIIATRYLSNTILAWNYDGSVVE